eukprot:ANDGO_04954.mRNA.1 Cilia- and flagella-associated protein 221 homolog
MSSLPVLKIPAKLAVEERPVVKNPLLSHNYTQTGRGQDIEVRPSIVHFGGFEKGALHEAKIHVVNVSQKPLRYHIIDPETENFKIRVNKKGSLPPGVSDTIIIQFQASELKYFFDCLRIHSENDHLFVPIHAYPAIAEFRFPSRIAFGTIAINTEQVKEVVLRNPVPVSFEFMIDNVEPHPDYEVSPLKGIVPGEGTAVISVTFRPKRLVTSQCVIRFQLSQFNFEPVMCTITGSCAPGVGLDDMAAKEKLALTQTGIILSSSKEAALASSAIRPPRFDSVDDKPEVVRQGGGAGGGDAYTQLRSMRFKESKRSNSVTETEVRRQKTVKEMVEGEAADRVRVDAHGVVARLLTQRPGKERASKTLRTRDSTGSVSPAAERSQSVSPRSSFTRARDSLIVSEELSGDFDFESHRQLAVDAERRHRAYQDWEKSKSIRWFTCIGEELLSDEEKVAVLERRRLAVEKRKEQTKQEDLSRKTSITLEGRRSVVAADELRDIAERAKSLTFNIYEDDGQAARRRLLEPFIQEARAAMVKKRVQRRLNALQNFAEVVQRRKTAVDMLLTPEHASTQLMPEKIVLVSIPVYRSENFVTRKAAEAPRDPPIFEDWELLPQKTALEYKVKGYVDDPVPSVDVLPGRDPSRTLLQGAFETAVLPLPLKSGVPLHSDAGSLNIPGLTQAEIASSVTVPIPENSVGIPAEIPIEKIRDPLPDSTVFVQRLPFTELSPEYLLRAVPTKVRSYSRFETPGLHSSALIRDYHTLEGLCPLARDVSDDLVYQERLASGEYDEKFISRLLEAPEEADLFEDGADAEGAQVGFPRPVFADVVKEFGLADVLVPAGEKATIRADQPLRIPMPADGVAPLFETPASAAEDEAERRIQSAQYSAKRAYEGALQKVNDLVASRHFKFSVTEGAKQLDFAEPWKSPLTV